MPARVFQTPQISLPQDVNVSDCNPLVVSTDAELATKYLINNYPYRSAWKSFSKGPVPPPFYLVAEVTGSTVGYSVYFNRFTGGSCPPESCQFQCLNQSVNFVDPSGSTAISTYCLNGEVPLYRFEVAYSSQGARESAIASFSFTFSDSNGNSSLVNVNGISGVKPMRPNAVITAYQDKTDTTYMALVAINDRTISGAAIDIGQIETFTLQRVYGDNFKVPEEIIVNRYFPGVNKISDNNDLIFEDRDVRNDISISYRTKFNSKYGESSQWSDWVTINSAGSTYSLITWTP